MKKRFRLSAFAAFLGLVYHLGAGLPFSSFRGFLEKKESVELFAGPQSLWSASLSSRSLPSKIDNSAIRLGYAGFWLRYQLRQFAFDMFEIPHSVPLRLFHRVSISQVREGAPLVKAEFIEQVGAFQAALRKRGVHLVVLPVPIALAIDGERFSSKTAFPASTQWGDLQPVGRPAPHAVMDSFQARTSSYSVNLQTEYEAYRLTHPEEELFIPYDFHWTSLGIAIAAKSVLQKLGVGNPRLCDLGKASVSYQRTLLSFLQLPPRYLAARPEFQFADEHFGLTTEISKPIYKRLVVVGTSFSLGMHEEKLGLSDLLAQALNVPVVLSASHGGGIRGNLLELKREGFQFEVGDVLVWEFPLVEALEQGSDPLPIFN